MPYTLTPPEEELLKMLHSLDEQTQQKVLKDGKHLLAAFIVMKKFTEACEETVTSSEPIDEFEQAVLDALHTLHVLSISNSKGSEFAGYVLKKTQARNCHARLLAAFQKNRAKNA